MALAFVDVEDEPAGNGSSGTSVNTTWANIPVVADHVILKALYKESTAAYTATPAANGWAQVAGFPVQQNTGGFKYQADLWWKRMTGSESGSDTWSWSGSTWRYSEDFVHSGAITSENPYIQAVAEEETAQNSQPSHPGITIQRSNSGLLYIVFNFSDISNTAAPTGFTYRQPGGTNNRNVLSYDDLTTTTGATGAVSGTLGGDIEYPLTVLIELATEAAAGGAASFVLPPPARRVQHLLVR